MGMLDDLLAAINTYPSDSVTVDVVDFEEPGAHINVKEICRFRVRVRNNGQLDMRNVRLHVEGSRFASVSVTDFLGIPTNFGSSVISGGRNIDAHASATFGDFHMRADAATGDGGTEDEDLFTIHVSSYDANLEHILRDHSHHAGNPEEAYHRHIHPE
ncbi:MAG: hypothetical protein ABFS34_04785 [Gemmatimonadota bacterium]